MCFSSFVFIFGTSKLFLFSTEQLAAQVLVKCLWDEPSLHNDRPPMYILWKLRDTQSTHKNIVTKSYVRCLL